MERIFRFIRIIICVLFTSTHYLSAIHITFANPANALNTPIQTGTVGNRIDSSPKDGYIYDATTYGSWTPNITIAWDAGQRIQQNWDVNDGVGGTVRNDGALFSTNTSGITVFTLTADPGYYVSLRLLGFALQNMSSDQTINVKIDGYVDETNSWEDAFQSDKTLSYLNSSKQLNTMGWIFGETPSRVLRFTIDASGLAQADRAKVGLTSFGFEQQLVPEPSTYALLLGACTLVWVGIKKRRFIRYNLNS